MAFFVFDKNNEFCFSSNRKMEEVKDECFIVEGPDSLLMQRVSLIDGKVVEYVPTFEELKYAKLSEINAAYNAATSALVSAYPKSELLTFDKQEAEARAWQADNSAETPLVDMLAAGRQIDKAELVRRIIAKADAFALATGYLTGQRQRYEDLLGEAQTVEEVEAIVPEYHLPEA